MFTLNPKKERANINITLPPTSIDNYFTGITALNIPDEDASTGDWHIKATFTPKKNGVNQFVLSANYNEINTNVIFGTDSITERSLLLNKFGIFDIENKPVYAANHYRAIADMLFKLLQENVQDIDKFIILSDWLPDVVYRQNFYHFFAKAKPFLTPLQWYQYLQWKS